MKKLQSVSIEMPQMALGGLSESWLFKELGALHWDMICDGLNTRSFDLKNETEDRLYATFVRIQIRCEKNLSNFYENSKGEVSGAINRFGNSLYFSDLLFETKEDTVTAKLMTSFAIRNKDDNTELAKSEPDVPHNHIEKLVTLPKFGQNYRLLKKRKLDELVIGDVKFDTCLSKEPIFTTDYKLNPYYDINGVCLLYFAAYPIINDYCEAQYFREAHGVEWLTEYYTSAKDVFYYANCNLYDELEYKLLDCQKIEMDKYVMASELSRKSDGLTIAKIFSIKSKREY